MVAKYRRFCITIIGIIILETVFYHAVIRYHTIEIWHKVNTSIPWAEFVKIAEQRVPIVIDQPDRPCAGWSGLKLNITLDTFQQNFSALSKSECNNVNDSWPNFELMMTLPASEIGLTELVNWSLPSMALFWPQQRLKLVLLTDNRTNSEHNSFDYAAEFQKSTKRFLGIEPKVFKTRFFHDKGWHKSQWLKFWADNFTEADFVGFVDTDTVFVTRVTLYDLFVNGKPIVRPIYGRPRQADVGFYMKSPLRTLEYTGFKEPFNCMSAFPMIIKRAHLAKMREVIEKRVDRGSFDEAFLHIIQRDKESEFNIMCAIMWHLFRNEYHWVITESFPGWQGYVPGTVDTRGTTFAPELFGPRPMLSIHWPHQHVGCMQKVLQRGVCYGMVGADVKPDFCEEFPDKRQVLNALEFQFETEDLSLRRGAFESHLKRLDAIDQCPHQWPLHLLKLLAINPL